MAERCLMASHHNLFGVERYWQNVSHDSAVKVSEQSLHANVPDRS